MIGRREDVPQIDYMATVQKRLKSLTGITSAELGVSEKTGRANADLRRANNIITIDHASRRLTIETLSENTDRVLTQVKSVWRSLRGAPTLRTR